jgi:ribosomal protein L22
MKEYTIAATIRGRDSVRTTTGTLEQLKGYFSYTIMAGISYENEPGNSKINRNPKTAKALVTALNNAKRNAARNGDPDTSYELLN